MNFAPYQEDSPDASRGTLLPEATTSRKPNPWLNSTSYQSGARVESLHDTKASSSQQTYAPYENTAVEPDSWVTRFGWRCDLEAAAAYVLGPLLAIPLLLAETHNNYVRFHAYQSLLLSALLGVAHLIILWSSFLSKLLLLVDALAFGFLAFRAFSDADSMRRHHLPYLGELAATFVEEE